MQAINHTPGIDDDDNDYFSNDFKRSTCDEDYSAIIEIVISMRKAGCLHGSKDLHQC